MNDPKPWVAFGPGFSGDYDKFSDAQAVVERHQAGGVYQLWARPRVPPKVLQIITDVADLYGLAPAEILSKSRFQPAVCARGEIARRLRETMGLSLTQIGHYIRRHHTSVLHSLRKPPGGPPAAV